MIKPLSQLKKVAKLYDVFRLNLEFSEKFVKSKQAFSIDKTGNQPKLGV
jgi:hypothetical protein